LPATFAAAPGEVSRGSTRANSSPPSRATVSPSRTLRRSRAEASRRSASPASWPEAVVDLLEPVEVEQQQPDPLAVAARLGQRLPEPVVEQRPVRQPGQGVVVGEVLGARLGRRRSSMSTIEPT
jgi:hypothetical protein